MTPEELVMRYLKTNDYITTKDAETMGVGRHTLSNLEKRGKLKRIKQGVYGLFDCVEDEYFLIQKDSEKVIFSSITALYLSGIIEERPDFIHITVPQGYNATHIGRKYRNVQLTYVQEGIFKKEIVRIETTLGNEVITYSPERCICEFMAKGKEQYKEIYGEVIGEFFKRKDINLGKLLEYSRRYKVEKEVLTYLEILRWFE